MQAHRLAALSAIVLYASAATGPAVQDLEGRRVYPVADDISVLIFTRTDCPISNRYAPEISRLAKRANARFWLVYVDSSQSLAAVRAHTREYGYTVAAVIDPKHELVKHSGASITPEVAVFLHGKLVYRGRIDNRHVDAGATRPAATVHDLEDVLSRISAGEPMKFRSTKAVGCFIEDLK